jgi:tetratricopeptide (TPR) repeat protein
MRKFLTTLTIPAIVVAGCAASSGGSIDDSSDSAVLRTAESESGPTQSDLIYRMLLGEFAGRRGRPDVALQQYLVLAREVPDPSLAERAVNIGLYAQRYEDALPAARRWVALSPENSDARRALILLLVEVGKSDEAAREALAWFGDAAQLGGKVSGLSNLLARARNPESAAEFWRRIGEAHPESAAVAQSLAQSALRAQDYDLALASTNRALRLEPDWKHAWLLKSGILAQQGKADESFQVLAEASERYPGDSTIGLAYARALIQEGRNADALALLRRLYEKEPGNASLLVDVGNLAIAAGGLDDAERYLKGALEDPARALDAYFGLGQVAERREDYETALDWFDRVAMGPREADAQVGAAGALLKLGRIAEADARFQELRDRNPELAVRVYQVQSEALREAGMPERALENLNAALVTYPGNHDLLYARALVAERLDRLDLLESDLRSVIDADPNNAHALNALGYTLADRTQRYDEALAYINRAIELSPNDAAILDSMGWVLYRLRRFDESLDYLKRAYAVMPDEEIGAHLGEVLWVHGDRQAAMDVWNRELGRAGGAPRVRSIMQRFGI